MYCNRYAMMAPAICFCFSEHRAHSVCSASGMISATFDGDGCDYSRQETGFSTTLSVHI